MQIDSINAAIRFFMTIPPIRVFQEILWIHFLQSHYAKTVSIRISSSSTLRNDASR